jgi:hypothetical protein
MSRKNRRPATCLVGFLVFVFACLSVGYYVVISVLGRNATEIEVAMARARELRLDSPRFPSPPANPSDNAATLFHELNPRVNTALAKRFIDKEKFFGSSQINALVEATRKPILYYDLQAKAWTEERPSSDEANSAQQLLSLEARACLESENWEREVGVLQALRRLTLLRRQSPDLKFWSQSIHCELETYRVIDKWLDQYGSPPSVLLPLSALIDPSEEIGDLPQVLRNEAARNRVTLEGLKTLADVKRLSHSIGDPFGKIRFPFAVSIPRPILNAWILKNLRTHIRISEQIGTKPNWSRIAEALEAAAREAAQDDSICGRVNQLVLPPLDDIAYMARRLIAERRLMRLKMAILLARKVPSSLAEFGRDGIDPMSGKPFLTKRTAHLFVISSQKRTIVTRSGTITTGRASRQIDLDHLEARERSRMNGAAAASHSS